VSQLLNFHMVMAWGDVCFLVVVPSILTNIVVFSAFVFSRMDLDQHRYLTFGCGHLGCPAVENPGYVRTHSEIWPTCLMERGKVTQLHEFCSCRQNSNV